ncbi:MAG TPA: energy transducer TonB [Pyrinomonadaceae bacterium]|jgi:TonB family protein|nr:energy transducer TonB [Pyrinomonadaceae bacterium]
MTRKWQVLSSLLLSAFVPLSTISICAQEKQAAPRHQAERMSGDDSQTPPPHDNFIFVASEMNSDGKLVKGAPYSAQAVTESTQTLSDGNRIINKSTATIYRDSEGRTRREQTLRMGPIAATGELPQSIFISDPVAGMSYALDTRTKTAHKMPPMRFEFKMRSGGESGGVGGGVGMGASVGVRSISTTPPPDMSAGPVFERMASPPGAVVRMSGPPQSGETPNMVFERSLTPPPNGEGEMVFHWTNAGEENAKSESLGKQSVEGVEAEGTRRTVEIPAGAIGNERPIEVVFERWYSPELQVVVMTKHSDPRFGEMIYRLTNISRTEPARELFEVPADYTLRGPSGIGSSVGIGSGGGEGISGGVLNGKAITLPLPEYPSIAKQAKASGSVTVEVTIDEDGNVTSARSVSGHPLLQSAAVNAARQAKFSPTKVNGQSVKVNGVLVYTFVTQ